MKGYSMKQKHYTTRRYGYYGYFEIDGKRVRRKVYENITKQLHYILVFNKMYIVYWGLGSWYVPGSTIK